jgi:hypothetical protein
MIAACTARLQIAHAEFLSILFPDGVTITAAVLVFVAAALAAALSPIVLWTYGRQIARLMRLKELKPPPPSWHERQRRRSTTAGTAAGGAPRPNAASPAELRQAADFRLSVIKRATWSAYAVFVVISPIFLFSTGPIAWTDKLGYCLAVPALAAVPALVNIRPQGSKRLIFFGMVALGIVLGLLEGDTGDGLSPAVSVPVLLGGLYFVTAHRKLRTLVVVMTAWLTVVLAGVVAAIWVSMPALACVEESSGPTEWSLAGIMVILSILTFTGFVHVGNKALHACSELHAGGFLSEISLAAGAGFALIALLLGFAISNGGPFPPSLVGLVTLAWIGATLCVYVLVIHGTTSPVRQCSLLVLRVFSRRRATEHLLDAVQECWRYFGPIYEIAGPDLARLNIDAHEMGKLMTARLHELFLFGATGDKLTAGLEWRSDREGRFRVNEVFCLESAWQATVERLMHISDAIILDVRGFTIDRQGTGFEVDLLARSGFLPRAVAIGDATTDWSHFDARIRAAGHAPEDVSRLQPTSRASVDQVLDALLTAASPGALTGTRTFPA